jgi:DnaD/phage-associated family protein
MNNKVILRPHNFIPYTLVPNFFIDGFLAKANGEFIKVYLVLLRYMSIGQLDFDLGQIADHLLMTESDVLRALGYFQSENLLTLTYSGNRLQEIHLAHLSPKEPDYHPNVKETPNTYPIPKSNEYSYTDDYSMQYKNHQSFYEPTVDNNNYVAEETTMPGAKNTFIKPQVKDIPSSHLKVISNRPEYTTKEIAVYAEDDNFSQLLYIVQKYLGKTLNSNEVKTIISFHDWLGLPIDVIELLIEYCVDNDHRNMRYIEKVAIDWADNEVNTLEKAKVRTETYNKSYFIILKAYGITDRSPTPNQIKLMDKWLNDYRLDISIIVEACERTIAQINKAEMRYTDTILETWAKEGIHTLSDVAALDQKRPSKQVVSKSNLPSSNKFSNYNQRSYDYEELEKKALELRLKESNGKRYSS